MKQTRPTGIAEARWQAVVHAAQDAIISIDGDGRITSFNRAAEQIFGYAVDELLGENVKLLMPPPYHDEHDQYLRAYQETGIPKAIGRVRHVEGCRKSGEVFPLELSVSEARCGDEVLYTAILRDVTEQARAEAPLRDSEAKIRAIVDTAVDAIITIDEHGLIESFNRGAERLFGYRVEEVLGHNVKMLMPPPYRDEHDQYLENYRATGVPKIIGIGREITGQRKDGTTFPMDLAVSEVRLQDKRVFTGIVRDLTERARREARLRALEDELRGAHKPLPLGLLTTNAHEILATTHRLEALIRNFVDQVASDSADLTPPASAPKKDERW